MDDELHCAGLIYQADEPVTVMTFTYGSKQLEHEFHTSAGILGFDCLEGTRAPIRALPSRSRVVLEAMCRVGAILKPSCVVCPSSTDLHQDHRVVHEHAMRAFRHVPKLVGWDFPNNERENQVKGFKEIAAGALEKKVEAWRCYQSQHHRTWFDEALIRSLAVVRGRQFRTRTGLAEGYEVLSCQI
jgi:LmbE family N-acetylglucosaminyl deacetylase